MDCSTSGDLARESQSLQLSSDGRVAAEAQFVRESVEPPGPAAAGCDTDAYWRREVAARLERYRSRRKPRAPRYPCLRLPFDAPETSRSGNAAAACTEPTNSAPNSIFCSQELKETEATDLFRAESFTQATLDARVPAPRITISTELESSNLIEFPRSAAVPVFHGSELAEPVLDRPRIVEAPEVVPAPPALGGILIEAASDRDSERCTPCDFLPRRAPVARRVAAAILDSLILGTTLAGFAEIFRQINPGRFSIPLLAMGGLASFGLLWAAYQFLFIVYTGSTPGSRVLRLHLTAFDGSPVGRELRRWRILASFLSAFSLGLGYLWGLLDEDGLCWHDRITHTYFEYSKSE